MVELKSLATKLICLCLSFILVIPPLQAQMIDASTLYLKTGVIVKGEILEIKEESVIFKVLLESGEILEQTIYTTMIYKLISPSGEVIILNAELRDDFEKNLARQSSVKTDEYKAPLTLSAQSQDSVNILTDGQQKRELSDRGGIWLSFGIGQGTSGRAISGDISYSTNDGKIIQLNFNFIANGSKTQFITEEVLSEAILVGKKGNDSNYKWAQLIGVGRIIGFHQGERIPCSGLFCFFERHEKIKFSTYGLLYNAQYFWNPHSEVGVGLNFAVCLNSETSFGVVLLSLRFGRYK